MSSSSVSNTITIASLNVASSRRDETKCSLYSRLDALKQFLVSASDAHDFEILCIQEIRSTGDMSVSQILVEIGSVLGKEWRVIDMAVNNSSGAFHRATFWNSEKLFHLNSRAIRTQNLQESNYPYMFLFHEFGMINDPEHKSLFTLINAHAPVAFQSKEIYWKSVAEHAKPDTIIVGDMNKFPEHHDCYKKLFITDKLEDKIGLDKTTFISFPWDSKPDGGSWISCLDAFITCPEKLVSTTVISTYDGFDTTMKDENKLRPSDHFMIVGKVNI